MNHKTFIKSQACQNLKKQAVIFEDKKSHLKNLVQTKDRFEKFSLKHDKFFYDFSRQRVDGKVLNELHELARETRAKEFFLQMVSGNCVNVSENRAALHTATRDFTHNNIKINDQNIILQITNVNQQIKKISKQIHAHELKGSTGKAFTDAVVIGIGGSYLGCDFVFNAVKQSIDPIINLHFLSNVDIDNFGLIIKDIDPETTLWIVISKSYTTSETMTNLNQVFLFLKNKSLNPFKHLVTVTAKGSPGDNPSNSGLGSFHMFDFIGGRYSVSSAVGGLPLSLAFGFDVFRRFLKGCHTMDLHAQNALEQNNIPLTAALLNIWNSNFLHYPAQAVIPYSSGLRKLCPHIQQLYMESLGKKVSVDGRTLTNPTGVVLFGEPGTNAQHSFFQLAHQGSPFPIEFIGVVKPVYNKALSESRGVYSHQELWANMIAQAQALAMGKDDDNNAKQFTGNRPSSTILINDLTPESIGLLLAFYEAKTVYEGFILGINPFDQFGVELGKEIATNIREQVKKKNRDSEYAFNHLDAGSRFYLDTLFKGSL